MLWVISVGLKFGCFCDNQEFALWVSVFVLSFLYDLASTGPASVEPTNQDALVMWYILPLWWGSPWHY